MPDPKSHELLQRYQDGDSDAAAAIFDRYVERLIALARARIGPKLRRRIDPEDVVQSAYRSFFVRAKDDRYQLERSGDLWRLLAATTLNKLYGQVEKQTAAKRSMNREVADGLSILKSGNPSVAEVVAVGEALRLIMDGLSHDERVVLSSTLQGQSIEEISSSIGKSERTVRRLLAQARQQFEKGLLATGGNSAPAEPRIVEPEAPLSFSDYLLEELLGSGGMGKVYRATEKKSGQTVAIKALHKARQSDKRAVAQFVQESQILAELRHPNIARVQGLGRFPAGGYFIVMNFVNGIDLQSRLEDGPLPLGEVVLIMKQVAGAITYAHAHGILHCDLKPANVLLDNAGRVVVTDFGFAFILADASSMNTYSIGGTAGYIAPEVLAGRSKPTHAADIFGLGVLMWRLATGKLSEGVDSPDGEDDSPAAVRFICGRCVARDPGQRYPSASDLLRALSALEKA